jgi:quinoprotein glucose dehydrogenase
MRRRDALARDRNEWTRLAARPHGVGIERLLLREPPAIVRGRAGWAADSDGQFWGEPSGVIRADAVTGDFAWAFDVGRPDVKAAPTGWFYARHFNSWSVMSVGRRTGLVTADWQRNARLLRSAASLVRRQFSSPWSRSTGRAETALSFQTTHHDLRDCDVASRRFVRLSPAGRHCPKALLQPTKRGEIFMLDRITGRAIDCGGRAVLESGGERTSSAHATVLDGAAYVQRPRSGRNRHVGITPLDRLWCASGSQRPLSRSVHAPARLTPYIQYPGYRAA